MITNRLDRMFLLHQKEYEDKAIEVLRSGSYILGKELEAFERNFAHYIGTKHSVGLASGLDALIIALKVLNISVGDEVIVPSNTYIASVMAITINGASPVFVEPDEYFNIDADEIESKITSKTKAILVVHLYGQASNMQKIKELTLKYNLKLIEDCAQSHGAKYNGQTTGAFGDIGCFSFYPSKNLGCFGDGGAITTNDDELSRKIKVYRNYGSQKRYHNEIIGTNSRLDEIQAGLLNVKLKHLQELEDERVFIAQQYLSQIKNQYITLPKVLNRATHVWHLFVIKSEYRSELMSYLQEQDIVPLIHYPIPPHLSEAYQSLNYSKGDFPIAEQYAETVLSIPLFNGMTQEEVLKVIQALNNFEPKTI